MKKLSALFLALVLIFSLAACGNNAEDSADDGASGSEESSDGSTIKMAALYGFTGSGSQVATSCKNAIDMMAANINENGIANFDGAKLEVVYGDNQSNEDVSKTTAERVLADEDILFCIGAGSSALLIPMLPITEKLHVPVLTNNSGDSITEQGYQYVFRCSDKSGTIPEFKTSFYQWLGDEKGYDLNKIGVLYVDYDYGISAAESAEVNYGKVGTIIESESFPADISDMSALITKFKASGVEIIDFTGELQNAKLLFDTMDAMNYHPLVIGGGGGIAQNEFATGLGDACIGVCSSVAFTIDQKNIVESEQLSGFIDQYYDLDGMYPDENAMFAIVEMLVAWDALEAAEEPTREAMRDAIAASQTEGFTWNQPVTFDETGNNTGASWVVAQWRKHEETGVYYLSCVYPEEAAYYEFIDPRG